MIIVRLQGGLGNQMFQYAFAKKLATKYKTGVKIDLTLLQCRDNIADLVIRNFDLDFFNLNSEFVTAKEIKQYNGAISPTFYQRITYKLNTLLNRYPLIIQEQHDYDIKQINSITNNSCIVGRWQSELYFKDISHEIKNCFSLDSFTPNQYTLDVYNRIKEKQIISIQIRRGDYVTHKRYSKEIGALDISYYHLAIEEVKKLIQKPSPIHFIIISDDIAWCNKNLKITDNVDFISQEKNKVGYFSDLWLLTKSNHSIISNSTFSWWGAWLSEKPESIIIAPKNWNRNKVSTNIVPDRWIQIDNKFSPLI